jgi:hypothetical protein
MVELFKEWLKAANDDLLVATNILENELSPSCKTNQTRCKRIF